MAKIIAFVCGFSLLFYPLWGRWLDPRPIVRRVYAAVGLFLLCWWGISLWLPSETHNLPENAALEIMLHLKWLSSGVFIGLILGLVVQGEFIPSRKTRSEGSKHEKATQEDVTH